ncbi:hypothetical protein BGZ63DRAFT_350836 [Mariannaea sp. PMI_226]|nr:hypothetical protein BGZ63DRAFT_350836 [Mariannaea sp. PMI_226]
MTVLGCHLVGSIPLNDAEAALRRCGEGLRGLLRSIPDGETGQRNYFVKFQALNFPEVLRSGFLDETRAPKSFTDAQARQELERLVVDTGYDEAALKSYVIFKELQSEGVIEKDIKFQVCLPSIANVVGLLVKKDFRHIVAPIYEQALFKSLKRIQELIPHENLAIQIDLGMDLAYWEDKVFEPWFSDKGYVVEYIVRMIAQVNPEVDLGIHYCYGDIERKHWAEPTSLGPIVNLHQELKEQIIREKIPRSIQWIHCPVPLSAMDNLDNFFKPLSNLRDHLALDKTTLYLGLVHPYDLKGTQERVMAAEKVVDEFGIATECGWGRISSQNEIESIMHICRIILGLVQR